jgi:hypothetical protein
MANDGRIVFLHITGTVPIIRNIGKIGNKNLHFPGATNPSLGMCDRKGQAHRQILRRREAGTGSLLSPGIVRTSRNKKGAFDAVRKYANGG